MTANVTNLFPNTDAFLAAMPKTSYPLNKTERFAKWIHEHTTATKVINISLIILGSTPIALLPLSMPVIGGAAIACAVVGGLIALVSAIALKVLDFIIAPSHDMSDHSFKPAKCEGGELYYENDVPILSITTEDSRLAGKAHGYLLGKQINEIRNRWGFANKFIKQLPDPAKIPDVLSKIKEKIPQAYKEELEGLRIGYNKWAKEQCFSPKPMTFDEVLVLHMLPDSIHFDFNLTQARLQMTPPVACTAVIHKDKNGFVFGRNMDWMTLGVVGTNTLIIRRQLPNGKCTAEVGVPGLIGTLTGMNDRGLSLCMNVCSGRTANVEGMPAIFFNRYVLENCDSVDEVDQLLTGVDKTHSPLGSYHLTVVDENKAVGWHLYQNFGGKPHIAEAWKGNTDSTEKNPLMVTNKSFMHHDDMHHSYEREQFIQELFEKAHNQIPEGQRDMRKLVERSLSLPYVNNIITAHTVVMEPNKAMSVCFNNAYSASGRLRSLTREQLFNRKE
jgi:hypothetical protein